MKNKFYLKGLALIVMTMLMFSCGQDNEVLNVNIPQEESSGEFRSSGHIFFIDEATGQDIGDEVTIHAQKNGKVWKRWPYKIKVEGVGYSLSVDFYTSPSVPKSQFNFTQSLYFMDSQHNQILDVTPKVAGTYILNAEVEKDGYVVAHRSVTFIVSEVNEDNDYEAPAGWSELAGTQPTNLHDTDYIVYTGNKDTKLPYLRFFEQTNGVIGDYQQELKSAEKAIGVAKYYKYVEGTMEFQSSPGNDWAIKVQYFINNDSYGNLIRLYDRRTKFTLSGSDDVQEYVGDDFEFIRTETKYQYGNELTIHVFKYRYGNIELKAYNDLEGNITKPGMGMVTEDIAHYVTFQFRRI